MDCTVRKPNPAFAKRDHGIKTQPFSFRLTKEMNGEVDVGEAYPLNFHPGRKPIGDIDQTEGARRLAGVLITNQHRIGPDPGNRPAIFQQGSARFD
jgi:hypothetical protein